MRSGQSVLVKKSSVKEHWYKKKSLNLLYPPVLIKTSGSENFEIERYFSIFLLFLFKDWLKAWFKSSLPL